MNALQIIHDRLLHVYVSETKEKIGSDSVLVQIPLHLLKPPQAIDNTINYCIVQSMSVRMKYVVLSTLKMHWNKHIGKENIVYLNLQKFTLTYKTVFKRR